MKLKKKIRTKTGKTRMTMNMSQKTTTKVTMLHTSIKNDGNKKDDRLLVVPLTLYSSTFLLPVSISIFLYLFPFFIRSCISVRSCQSLSIYPSLSFSPFRFRRCWSHDLLCLEPGELLHWCRYLPQWTE